MAEQIISASGTQYGLIVNPDGSINISSDITISGVTIDFVTIKELAPTNSAYNNSLYQFKYAYSGTSTGIIGSEIGSIVQFIGTGSYVQVLQYTNNVLTQVGSWF